MSPAESLTESAPLKWKPVIAWALYDWANSAFATSVLAGFIQAFYGTFWHPGVSAERSTAELNFVNAFTGILVALMAPVLGAIADRGGAKKGLLFAFLVFGVVGTGLLAIPGQGQYVLALTFFGIGAIGFAGANVFYDSLLVDVAPRGKLDFVSSFGFALGYLGGGLLFLVNVIMVSKPELFDLPDKTTAVRVAFLTVAVWWALFSVFLFVFVKERKLSERPSFSVLARDGFRQVARTFAELKRYRTAFVFLLAYVFYIDGVNTVIRTAVKFGSDIGFETADLMKALLLVQFVGFPAAIVFGWIGQRIGPRRGILIGVGAYACITLLASQMNSLREFYALAFSIACFQGGVQALSRSYFASQIPGEKAGEFFGFYNMVGKFTAIIGLTLMAVVGLVWESVRVGLASVTLLFIVGGAILLTLREKPAPQSPDVV